MQTEVQRILSIVEVFGMKALVAQAMGILQQTFYSKKDYKNDRHKFSEKNAGFDWLHQKKSGQVIDRFFNRNLLSDQINGIKISAIDYSFPQQ